MSVTWTIQGSVLILALDGDYAFGEVIESVQYALADPSFTPGTLLLFDERLSRANASGEEIRDRIHWIGSLRSKGFAARCAIVVGAELYRYGLARMAATYLDLEGIQAEVFSDVESASRWLSGAASTTRGTDQVAVAGKMIRERFCSKIAKYPIPGRDS
jgi:hypothetical protein